MKVLLDENGYVKSFAFVGDLVDGIEIPDPGNLDHFAEHFGAYTISDGQTLFNEEQDKALQHAMIADDLRIRREKECFSVINRGQLWYEGVTVLQLLELRQWYKDWLNVTETFVVPEKPSWLN